MEGIQQKKKLISSRKIAIIFLMIGILLLILNIFLALTNPSASLETRFTYNAFSTLGLGLISGGILIAVLSLVRILERVG